MITKIESEFTKLEKQAFDDLRCPCLVDIAFVGFGAKTYANKNAQTTEIAYGMEWNAMGMRWNDVM